MVHFACDIGGTRIKLGLVRAGTLLARTEIEARPEDGFAAALDRVAREKPAVCSEAGVSVGELTGFALAFPGIIEPGTDRILSVPAGKFDDVVGTDAHEIVQRVLGLPVFIINDANAALAGEWQFGAARGCRNVVMMTLGTGIGTSAIIEGVPLRGQHGQAGCLGGHMPVSVPGALCRCGNLGCAETEASTWVLPQRARAYPGFAESELAKAPALDYRAVFECAARGDRVAVELRERAFQVWSAAAVALIHAYDPERMIVGGGIMQSATEILEVIRAHVACHAWTPWGKVVVAAAALGNDAGLIGAAASAETHFKGEREP